MSKVKKYQSTGEFVKAALAGKFKGVVIVDNDCVTAHVDEEEVFNFGDQGPEGALVDVLEAIGAKADFA